MKSLNVIPHSTIASQLVCYIPARREDRGLQRHFSEPSSWLNTTQTKLHTNGEHRHMEFSDEEDIKTVWAAGKNWVIKRKNHQYFYRPDREYGDWKSGLPPDTFEAEIDVLFDD
jgi:hypothetical protein